MGVGQVVTCEHHLLFDDQRPAIALDVALGAEGHQAAGLLGRTRFGAFVDHAHLQGGGAAQDVLGLGRVLHAGQLHHDAVQALLLNHRLGHAQLIDPVVQRGDVLFECLLLHLAGSFGLDAHQQAEFGAIAHFTRLQIGKLLGDQAFGRFLLLRVTHADFDVLAIASNAAMANVFFAHRAAQVPGEGFQPLGQRRLHVHLQHEVHATAQIQAQVHGRCVQSAQPGG